ncbi:TRAP transporter small permease [Janthinobacterium sp. CG_S6]|uniref:TRAP transporter small permease n=1 Tax=Janthinobacterium sp. CG_S6 TaxID=3071707 RepID=UPI002E0281F5|nr:TRAP-type C4-dicarboxylate transport system permease small subunit [Janthinobacterium sp. CG_S6]
MKYLVLRLERTVEYLMALALAIMVALVFGNVLMRYLFNSGFAAAEEVARLMFVWLIFLGAILALRHHGHLGVAMLQAKLPRPLRRACAVVSHLLMLYGLYLFASGSWAQTVIGMDSYSTVLRYPTAFMAASGLVCSVSMIVIVAVNLWRIVSDHPRAAVPGDPVAEFAHPELHGSAK